ncbi:MAG: hypothetical protein HYV41_02905 [Candidatus Magasanikbacteria bacterium]|nr:hypothetical protein [Candidatus Magasanikbacteria bacterium]
MKRTLIGTFKFTPDIMMQKAGYHKHVSFKTKETSYIRRLGSLEYPHFHVYIDVVENSFQINLHLDQKKPSYGEHTAHSGEYDGEFVEEEIGRVGRWFELFLL